MIDIGIKRHPIDPLCVAWYYKEFDDKMYFYDPDASSDEVITTETRRTKLVKTRTYEEFSWDQITHETLHRIVNIINGESSIIDKLQNEGVVP